MTDLHNIWQDDEKHVSKLYGCEFKKKILNPGWRTVANLKLEES